jgi:hypothetical protein
MNRCVPRHFPRRFGGSGGPLWHILRIRFEPIPVAIPHCGDGPLKSLDRP